MTKRNEIIQIIYFGDDEMQSLLAWEEIKKIDLEEDSDCVFWSVIAIKRNGTLAHEKVREKAWNDMLKRGIKNPERTLYYLSVNASEPYNYEARDLLSKYIADKKSLKNETKKLLKKRLAKPS